MADYEAPSFSLGLDLETQSEPQIPTPSSVYPPHPDDSSDNPGVHANCLDEVVHEEVMDSDPEPGPQPTRVLQRLRRGIGQPGPSVKTSELELISCGGNGDDDIEDFSSQEDLLVRDDHQPAQYNYVCSSSKIPLRGCGVLTTESSSLWKARKRERAADAPSSASVETSHFGLMFPQLTVSPLRRFQLLGSDSDSDSDHPSFSEDVKKRAHRTEKSSKESELSAREQKKKVSVDTSQKEDLWKDVCPMKSFHIPTPALDEVCEEYFQSVKDKNAASIDTCVGNKNKCHTTTSTSQIFEEHWDSSDPLPPAHHYFLHDDPRIQKLVHNRLPNFSPLGIVGNGGNQQPSAPVINYMSQFSNGEASKGTQKTNSKKSSTRGRNKSEKSNDKQGLHASEGWVDPKSSSAVPKDAGKRRVHANGQSSGHWYTSPEGRKVYISRSGQELSGQMAYRQYRKESGAGFKKSKNKTSSKRKKG